jgi:pyruvate kinase
MSASPHSVRDDFRRPSQTKIVATVGPATTGVGKLDELIKAGVDVFRVNTAHGDRAEHQARVDTIRRAASEAGKPVAILADLAGPKIRLGELPDGQLQCNLDDELRFVRGNVPPGPGQLTTTYGRLVDELAVGDPVMLADGTVGLSVVDCDGQSALCRVVQPGVIRSRQGVNLPGVRLSIPTLGEVDRQNAVWAAKTGIDFLGLSFVRSADDVEDLKSLIRSQDSTTQVIAKIEKPEALERLDEILAAADGIMVARGDLGVEIDIAEMAVVQKKIVAACRRADKPVIIATQMLDSMQHSRLPTRAEATDVANAILDGADACMLSGETAIGRHPVEAVQMMHRIALATEPLVGRRPSTESSDAIIEGVDQITRVAAQAAGRMAEELAAKMVVVASASGETALSLSKNRNFVPTIGVSSSDSTLRRMCLYWGVIPLPDAPVDDGSRLLEHVVNWGRHTGQLTTADRVILLTGTHVTDKGHNTIVVHEVE